MPRAAQHSTASGQPDHLFATTVPGVTSGVSPVPPTGQLPPHYSGLDIPLDPMLKAAGAFFNAERQLVRRWRIHDGPPTMQGGRLVQRFRVRERLVAPPGMSIEDARVRGLDFYSPAIGWIRAGVKRETEAPENMGTGHQVGEIEYEDVEAAPEGEAGAPIRA